LEPMTSCDFLEIFQTPRFSSAVLTVSCPPTTQASPLLLGGFSFVPCSLIWVFFHYSSICSLCVWFRDHICDVPRASSNRTMSPFPPVHSTRSSPPDIYPVKVKSSELIATSLWFLLGAGVYGILPPPFRLYCAPGPHCCHRMSPPHACLFSRLRRPPDRVSDCVGPTALDLRPYSLPLLPRYFVTPVHFPL